MGSTQATDPGCRRVPLARGNDGEPFTVPADASAWRVRRFRNPGRPGACELVYGDDAAPLEIGIDTPISEFKESVGHRAGRYRLDAVDADGVVVAKLPPAYLQIDASAEPRPANTNTPTTPVDPMAAMMREMVEAYRELARENTALARAVIERFPAMVDSAAGLLRAADGAGLPQRAPLDTRNAVLATSTDNTDGDDEVEVPPDGWPTAITQMVGQLMPMVQAFVAHRMGGPPRNSSAPDAAPDSSTPDESAPRSRSTEAAARKPNASAAATAGAESVPKQRKGAEPAPMTPTPEQLAHFALVQAALAPREAQIATTLAVQLKPTERAAWLGELARRSVDDAVALIRRHLAQTAPNVRGPAPELGVRKPDTTAARADDHTHPEESQ